MPEAGLSHIHSISDGGFLGAARKFGGPSLILCPPACKFYEGAPGGSVPRVGCGWFGGAVRACRRDFFKMTCVGRSAAAVFGLDLKPAFAELRTLKISRA